MKKKVFALLMSFMFLFTVAVPAFADSDERAVPGLVSERVVEYENGITVSIQVYDLDDNGNLPIPQPRGLKTLYNGTAYLDTLFPSDIVTGAKTGSFLTEAVTCYNYGNYDGAGAVTFHISIGNEPTTQAVDAGQAAIFTIDTNIWHKYSYDVEATANWWADSYRLKVTSE